MFLEECNYFVKEKKVPKFTIDNIGISSDDSDREDFDEENPNEENQNIEFFWENIGNLVARKFHFAEYKIFLISVLCKSLMKYKKKNF